MTDETIVSPFGKEKLPFDIPKNTPPRFLEEVRGDMDENDLRAAFIKNKAGGTFAIAEWLTKKYSIITVGTKEYEVYVYQDGIFFQATNAIIYPEVQRILGGMTTQSAKLETVNKIASMTIQPRTIFTLAPLNFINLANGVYDTRAKVLLPHDPKYLFTHKFPIVYDPTATCPLTDAFLNTILDAGQRLTVEEWIGFTFLRDYRFKKSIIFVGEGDTGKTTLLEVMTHLLGMENISSVSLQKMSSDKFAAASLYGKHANIVDELSARDISDTGAFKQVTGGGSISGEYKFGSSFVFQNFASLTFACNKIPDVKDFDDQAYFNRWMVIRFDKIIENKVPNFIKTLTTEAERSGLFNLAMRGLDRLLEQGRFSYNKTALETKLEMMRSGSSIAQFAADALMSEPGAEMSKEDMYDHYTKFCTEHGLAPDTMNMLGSKLQLYATYITDGQMTVHLGPAKRARCWRNVIIKKGAAQQRDADDAEVIFNS